MPPKTKVKVRVCNEPVKQENGLLEPCGYTFKKDEYLCPQRAFHLSKLKTGMCVHQRCEGSAPKSPSTGKPQPTCQLWKTCPCDCHEMYDLMFREAGLPRQAVDNSGYVPPHNPYWVPTPEERAMLNGLSITSEAPAPVRIESPDPDRVPATIARTFTPTNTGRAARGELESWVKRVCDEWLVDAPGSLCSPAYVARQIQRNEGLGKEPSVGAISAVWDRWVSLGFAVIEKKPTRFVAYTDEGIRTGLEGLKERAKRQRKLQQGADIRAGRR